MFFFFELGAVSECAPLEMSESQDCNPGNFLCLRYNSGLSRRLQLRSEVAKICPFLFKKSLLDPWGTLLLSQALGVRSFTSAGFLIPTSLATGRLAER